MSDEKTDRKGVRRIDRRTDREDTPTKMDYTDACEKTFNFSELALEVCLFKVMNFKSRAERLKRVRERKKEIQSEVKHTDRKVRISDIKIILLVAFFPSRLTHFLSSMKLCAVRELGFSSLMWLISSTVKFISRANSVMGHRQKLRHKYSNFNVQCHSANTQTAKSNI